MLNEKTIKNLEKVGFKRWTKGNFDRLYINPCDFGLSVSHYKSGNISSATFNHDYISNSLAKDIIDGKYFVDVVTEKITVSSSRHTRMGGYVEDAITESIEKLIESAKTEEGEEQ